MLKLSTVKWVLCAKMSFGFANNATVTPFYVYVLWMVWRTIDNIITCIHVCVCNNIGHLCVRVGVGVRIITFKISQVIKMDKHAPVIILVFAQNTIVCRILANQKTIDVQRIDTLNDVYLLLVLPHAIFICICSIVKFM